MWFTTLVLTTLTLGLEFAHVLEWPQKQQYPGALYVRLQESLYIWFGNLGGVLYVLAVVASVVLVVLLRRDRPRRGWVGVAAGLQVIALVTFLTIVYPVNLRLPVNSAGAVPPDWTALRDRWELGHTIGFVLFGVSFVLLVAALVRQVEAPGRAVRTETRSVRPAGS